MDSFSSHPPPPSEEDLVLPDQFLGFCDGNYKTKKEDTHQMPGEAGEGVFHRGL